MSSSGKEEKIYLKGSLLTERTYNLIFIFKTQVHEI